MKRKKQGDERSKKKKKRNINRSIKKEFGSILSYGFLLTFVNQSVLHKNKNLICNYIPKSAIKEKLKRKKNILYASFGESEKKQYEVLIETMQGVMEHRKKIFFCALLKSHLLCLFK